MAAAAAAAGEGKGQAGEKAGRQAGRFRQAQAGRCCVQLVRH